jgi:hypothetical protein
MIGDTLFVHRICFLHNQYSCTAIKVSLKDDVNGALSHYYDNKGLIIIWMHTDKTIFMQVSKKNCSSLKEDHNIMQ